MAIDASITFGTRFEKAHQNKNSRKCRYLSKERILNIVQFLAHQRHQSLMT